MELDAFHVQPTLEWRGIIRMSTFNLETAITTWRAIYERRRVFGKVDLDEMERHLRDQVNYLTDSGIPLEEAFRKASSEFGSVFEAENEFRKLFWRKLWSERKVGNEMRWRLSMLARYLQIGARSLSRQKVVSFINIFGLSVALACSICVYVFLDSYLGMDRFHENGEQIYLVSHNVEREGEMQRWGRTPIALAPSVIDQIPGVAEVVRVEWESGRMFVGETVFDGSIQFVDPAYLDVMTFPVLSGDLKPLSFPDGAAITAAAAEKYFGDTEPVGQTLTFTMAGQDRVDLTIRSVLAPLPGASGTRFEVLAPFPALSAARSLEEGDWNRWVSGTIILTQPGLDPTYVESQLNAFVDIQNAANADWQIESFFLDNLRDPVDKPYLINNRLMEAPHPIFVFMLILIPLAMLALSIFNYINIAIGATERRLKEIGIRKVSGGVRAQLIAQFMVENLVLCTVSLVIAGLISWLFLLPMFDELFVYALTWAPTYEPTFWFVILGILLGTSVISGAYPALYISSLDPVNILKGSHALPGRRMFSHVFLAGQFTIAFFSILIGMFMAFGGDFAAKDGWGYDPDSIVAVRMESSDQFGPFRDTIQGKASVLQVSAALHHVGGNNSRATVSMNGQDEVVGHLRVGSDYFSTLGLEMLQGRGFEDGYGADVGVSVVVNASFAQRSGWDDPIGQGFISDSTSYQVVGVVENPMLHPIMRYRPVFFTRIEDTSAAYAIVRGSSEDSEALLSQMKTEWENIYPETPFDGFRQSGVFDIHVQSWKNLTDAMTWLSMLALIISCMGLFGLSSQGVAARMKEVSIRKVLGANPAAVALRVHVRYLILISVGAVISMPVVYFGLVTLIDFAELYHIVVGPGVFIGSYSIVMAVAFISIAKHAWSMMRVNPAVSLRGE